MSKLELEKEISEVSASALISKRFLKENEPPLPRNNGAPVLLEFLISIRVPSSDSIVITAPVGNRRPERIVIGEAVALILIVAGPMFAIPSMSLKLPGPESALDVTVYVAILKA